MGSIATKAQRAQGRQADILKNQTNDGIIQSNIPRHQPPNILVKGSLQHQLRNSQVKISLFELLQQSKDHREGMNKLLQIIELDINNSESFVSFVGNIKINKKPTIFFHDHKGRKSNHLQCQDPPLHIIAKIDGKDFKRILIYEGSVINIISTIAYKNLNLPFSHICAPS